MSLVNSIVVWPGELSTWLCNHDELGSGTSVEVTDLRRFTHSRRSLQRNTDRARFRDRPRGTPAQGTISCNPPIPGLATQNIVVATVKADICGDV